MTEETRPGSCSEPAQAAAALASMTASALLQQMPVATFLCDRDGLVTAFNPEAAKLWERELRLNDPADRFAGLRWPASHGATEHCIAQALRTGESQRGSATLVTASPPGLRVLLQVNPLRDAAGEIAGAACVVVSNDEEIFAEAAEHDRLLDSIGRALPHWFYVFDCDRMALCCQNRSLLRDLGHDVADDEATNELRSLQPYFAVGEEAHLQRLLEEWQRLADGELRDDEYFFRHADGSIHTFAGRETVLARRPDGSVRRIVGTLTDITREKESERRQRQTEASYRLILEGLPVGVFLHDGERLFYANPRSRQILGAPSEEALYRMSPLDIVAPEFRDSARQRVAHMLSTGEVLPPIEAEVLRFDGVRAAVEVHSRPTLFEGRQCVQVLFQDVTERRRAAEAQRRRLVELTTLSRIGKLCSEASAELDVLSGATRIIAETLFPDNCGFLLLDFSRNSLVTDPGFIVTDASVPLDEKPLGVGVTGKVAQSGVPRRIGDVADEPDYLAADPRTRSELCVPMKIGGKIVGVLNIESQKPHAFDEGDEQLAGAIVDLVGNTLERLRAAHSLAESESRYRQLTDLASSFTYQATVSPQYEIQLQWISGRFFELTGYQPQEMQGRNWLKLIHPEELPSVLRLVDELRQPGGSMERSIELRIVTSAGETRWVRSVTQPAARGDNNARDEQGVVMYGVVLDITERKLAEEAMLRSEQKYRYLVETAHDLIWSVDVEGRWTFLNGNGARNIYGCEPVEMLGRLFSEFTAEELIARDLEVFRRLKEGRPVFHHETVHHRRDGTPVYLSFNAVPFHAPDGALLGTTGTAVDVTEQRRTQQALTLFRTLIDHVTDAVEVIDATNGKYLDVNENACRAAGYTRQEYLRLGVPDLDPNFPPEKWDAISQKIRESDYLVVDTIHRRKDGTTFPVEVNAVYVRLDREYILAVVRDISERKQAEEALRASEQRMSMAVAATNVGVWDWNVATGAAAFSPEWKQQIGYAQDEFPNSYAAWESHLHPEDRPHVMSKLQAYLNGSQSDYSVEFRLRHKDGSYRWIYTRGIAWRDEQGQPTRMLGCHVDITDRKRAEEAMRESSERLTAVIRHTPNVAIQWYDAQGRVKLWNEASEAIFGYSDSQALGKTLDQLIHTPEEFTVFLETLQTIAETGRSIGPNEYSFRRSNGAPGVCLSSLFRIPGDEAGDWFVCMDVDVTASKQAEEERRRLESQILHAQKLESLGVLASGIAHDFNNLLTVMLGYTQVLQWRLSENEPALSMVREIEKAARRATELTRQMLAYAGKGKLTIEPLRIDVLVREMVKLLQSVISKKADLQLHLRPVVIEGDATQLRQVLMNLITNASDALEDRVGTIVLRVELRECSTAELSSPYHPEPLPAGEYAVVEVEDTGCGMDAKTLDKIFDPFFTTKFTGRGLGLAAVLGIVRSHRGAIKVSSTPGQGTRFQLFFPAAAAVVLSPAEGAPQPLTTGDRGLILVVEDEPAVRDFAREVLLGSGYDVVTAEDGAEGLRLFTRQGSPICAVLLDLTMPRMDGFEFLQQLRTISADTPIIVMSGYGEPDVAERSRSFGANAFLEKPFDPGELLKCLRQWIVRT